MFFPRLFCLLCWCLVRFFPLFSLLSFLDCSSHNVSFSFPYFLFFIIERFTFFSTNFMVLIFYLLMLHFLLSLHHHFILRLLLLFIPYITRLHYVPPLSLLSLLLLSSPPSRKISIPQPHPILEGGVHRLSFNHLAARTIARGKVCKLKHLRERVSVPLPRRSRHSKYLLRPLRQEGSDRGRGSVYLGLKCDFKRSQNVNWPSEEMGFIVEDNLIRIVRGEREEQRRGR